MSLTEMLSGRIVWLFVQRHAYIAYCRMWQSMGRNANPKKTAMNLWFRETRTTWSLQRTDVHKGHGKMLYYYYFLFSISNDVCTYSQHMAWVMSHTMMWDVLCAINRIM